MAPSHIVTEQAFNHIALPPRLPDHDDSGVGDVNREIISRAIRAANAFISFQHSDSQDIWVRVKESLELCDSTHEDGQIDRHQLMKVFTKVEQNTSLILHVAAQNAGLFIQPTKELGISLPRADDVAAYQGLGMSTVSNK
jgi:hypothetical protein